MTRMGFVAFAAAALLLTGCGSHSFSLYPAPDRSVSTYASVRQLRSDRNFDASVAIARFASLTADGQPTQLAFASTPAAPRTAVVAAEAVLPASSTPAPTSVASSQPDAPGRFVCGDGATLDISYSLDRRTATVRTGDGAAIELSRTEDTGLPTYVRDGTTLRSMGPRIGWSTSEGEATVTVQAGDTLSRIALRRYGSLEAVDAIVRANADRIADANLIFPGQVLTLPGASEQSCRKLAAG